MKESESPYMLSFYSPKAKTLFGWLDWIISEGLPFCTVEKPLTRKYSSLSPISLETFQKYKNLLTIELEKKIATILPERFVLIFDGWSLEGASTHYIALFAQWMSPEKTIERALLAFSPLLDENDMTATSHKEFIVSHLEVYEKTLDNVICLVGDNANTNKALADQCNKPLIGCASHRFNLEVQEYLKQNPWNSLLDKVHNLMLKLRTLKNSALLRNHTQLRPQLRCSTRWSGSFAMVKRYFEIKDAVIHISNDTDELQYLLLNVAEERSLTKLFNDMVKLWSVTCKLQTLNLTLLEVRVLFDKVIDCFPAMNRYISIDAPIIHSPSFESGLVKILNGDPNFNQYEIRSLLPLKIVIDEPAIDTNQELSFADNALIAVKKKRDPSIVNLYLDPSFIPCGSVIVESLFSVAGQIFDEHRIGTLPVHVEEQMFLKSNRLLWNMGMVSTLVHKNNF
jgi:hypothetical protein